MITEYFCLQLRQALQVAVPVSSTLEVLTLMPNQICAIPGVDPVLQGVVNWRGKLLWSLDLSDFLGLRIESADAKQAIASTLTAIVIAQDNPTRQLACIVSSLRGVQEILDSQVQPIATHLPSVVHQYSNGIVSLDSPLLLLNPSAILNSPRWQYSVTNSLYSFRQIH
ncbi:MAG TPA: chemotaxis protein CheW [Crinalium sp.]|jgi:twitching motility protein PilI